MMEVVWNAVGNDDDDDKLKAEVEALT